LASVLLAATSAPVHAAPCTTLLQAPVAYSCGSTPQAIALGDLDRDGRLDAVVANGSAHTFHVLRGLAGGAFAAPVSVAASVNPRALTLADLDEDGILDLLLAVSSGVQRWRGLGDATFALQGTLDAGTTVRAIVAADLDADGILDVATANSGANEVQVLLGRGTAGRPDGTFAPAMRLAVGTGPTRLLACDLDADGVLDLATADNSGGTVSLLRALTTGGRPSGAFAASVRLTVGGSPAGLAHGDLNGDGRVDLAVTSGSGSVLTVLRRQAGGTYATSTFATPLAARELVLADLDADGIADAVMACAATNQLAVLSGTGAAGVGDGGFAAARTFGTGTSPTALAVADLDADLRPDAVVVNTGAGSVWRFRGACAALADGSLTLLSPTGGEPWWPGLPQRVQWQKGGAVTAVDVELSGDGGATWQPLATSVTGSETWVVAPPPITQAARVRVRDSHVSLRAAASAAAFDVCGLLRGPVTSLAVPPGARRMLAADLDSDGWMDAAVATDTSITLVRGDGLGQFELMAHAAAAAPRALAAADLDRDARMDVVTLEGDALVVRDGIELDRRAARSVTLPAPGQGLAIGDLDDDGDVDAAVVTRSGGTGALVLLHADASGALSVAATHVLDAPGARVLAADLDGDGTSELALTTTATLEVWRRASGVWARVSERLLASPVGDLAWGDFDRDGMLDLAACLPATGDVWRFRGDAATLGFAAPSAFHAGVAPAHLGVTDWDGDGRADLVLSASVLSGAPSAGLTLLLGDATLPAAPGSFAAAEHFGDGATAGTALAIADFDGDHAPDALLATASGALELRASQCAPQMPDSLAWIESPAAQTTLAPGDVLPLRWSHGPAVDTATLELSRDDGVHWEPLAPVAAGERRTWRVHGPATNVARLRVRDAVVAGRQAVSERFAISGAALAVEPGALRGLALSRPWPQPARGPVRLQLTLGSDTDLRIEVLDLQGRRVRLLAAGPHAPGSHTIEWDGRDDRGLEAPPGVAFVRVLGGESALTRRVLRVP